MFFVVCIMIDTDVFDHSASERGRILQTYSSFAAFLSGYVSLFSVGNYSFHDPYSYTGCHSGYLVSCLD